MRAVLILTTFFLGACQKCAVWSGDVSTGDVEGLCSGRRCLVVEGDLTVEDSKLTDLTDLSCVEVVEGSVRIGDPWSSTRTSSGYTDLVEGRGNPDLRTLRGLHNLREVGERLSSSTTTMH